MATNKYYNPSRGKYVSQFVPDQLPAELMLSGIGRQQQKYDAQSAANIKLGEWEQAALSGGDTDYVASKKEELQSFIDGSLGKDLASQEYASEYSKFINKFKNDEGLSKVNTSYMHHQDFLEREKKLKEGKGTDYDQAFVDNYYRHYNAYTAKGGKGFAGEVQLADATILEGVDINAEGEKFFDHIKESGSESLATLANGLSYKNGWTGVSGQTIDNQTTRLADQWYDSRAGQQLQARFMADNVPYGITHTQYENSLTGEDRANWENKKRSFVVNELNNIGQGFVRGKSTTNKDVALRDKWKADREDAALYAQELNLEVAGNTTGNPANFVDDSKAFKENTKYLAELNKESGQLAVLQKQIMDLGGLPKGQKLPEELRDLIQGIPGSAAFLEGNLDLADRKRFGEEIQKKIDENVLNIQFLQTDNSNKELRYINTIQGMAGDTKFGEGLSYTNAIDVGRTLKEDPLMAGYIGYIEQVLTNPKVNGKQAITLVSEEIKRDYENGVITKEEATKLLQNSENAVGYAEAIRFTNVVTQEGDNKAMFEGAYQKNGSYQPTAVVIASSETYTPFTFDENGVLHRGKPTQRADYAMQNQAQNNLSGFAVYLDGQRIEPGDPKYPDPSTIKFSSTNRELVNGKPVFNGSAIYTNVSQDLRGIKYTNGEDKGEIKKTINKVTGNYTFVAEGNIGDVYLNAKSQEAMANVVSDPGYDNTKSFYNQTNLNSAGQSSLKSYYSYIDPSLAKTAADMENMKGDNKMIFMRNSYNPYSGKEDQITYHTTRKGNGEYVLEITDSKGRNMMPSKKTSNFNSAAELTSWIKSSYEAQANELRGSGVINYEGTPNTTDTPYNPEGSFVPNVDIYKVESEVDEDWYAAPSTPSGERFIKTKKDIEAEKNVERINSGLF